MILYKGAEATLYKEKYLGQDAVRKERVRKKYKDRDLDDYLRFTRTKNEAHMLSRSRAFVRTPFVYDISEDTILMEFLNGKKIKEVINEKIAFEIGKKVRSLHDGGVVHNDLTTSNMILCDGQVCFIDFGLSQSNASLEDKAVDLIVFKKMLSSSHYKIFKEIWEKFLRGYKPSKGIRKKMNDIETRVKYK